MKKTLAFVLALCMIFALCACGSNANTPAPAQNNDAQGGADAGADAGAQNGGAQTDENGNTYYNADFEDKTGK